MRGFCALLVTLLYCGSEGCGTGGVLPTLPPIPGTIRSWKELLGGNVKGEPITSRGPGPQITGVEQLACNTFTEPPCRWHNVPENTVPWRRGRGRPEVSKLSTYTNAKVPPVEPYAFAYPLVPPSPAGVGKLVSDPIRCQRGSGELSLTYWISRNIQLMVCARQKGQLAYFYCSAQLGYNGSPGPAYLNIPQPTVQDFEV